MLHISLEKGSKFDIFSASPPSFFREPHDQMKIPGQYFDSISRNLPCVVLQCDTHTEGRIRIKTDIRSKYAGLKRDCWGLQGSRIRLVLGCVFHVILCEKGNRSGKAFAGVEGKRTALPLTLSLMAPSSIFSPTPTGYAVGLVGLTVI